MITIVILFNDSQYLARWFRILDDFQHVNVRTSYAGNINFDTLFAKTFFLYKFIIITTVMFRLNDNIF